MRLFRGLLIQQNKIDNGINPIESKAGDICLYNISAGKLIIVDGETFDANAYPSSNYSPVGVVVVPGSHDIYGDGSCGIISLKEMDYGNPDNGTTSYKGICWGGNGVDISSLTNYEQVCCVGNYGSVSENVTFVSSYAHLPSDKFNTVENPYDIGTGYYYNDRYGYIPSPYKNDGTFNVEYSRISSPSSGLNAMSDFDGANNTKKIIDLATSDSDWKTANTISNNYSSGYYPAACCCWRYHTDGTNQGDWYLPACGEFGYVMTRFNKINNSIQKIINTYGDSDNALLDNTGNYWISSEYGGSHARYITISFGYVYINSKSNSVITARAFLRVK